MRSHIRQSLPYAIPVVVFCALFFGGQYTGGLGALLILLDLVYLAISIRAGQEQIVLELRTPRYHVHELPSHTHEDGTVHHIMKKTGVAHD